jgi:hypothetical protein
MAREKEGTDGIAYSYPQVLVLKEKIWLVTA